MKRTNVQSSNIKSVWYDMENSVLGIEFHHWWVYHYSWVPVWVYNSLISSSSVGSYFSNNIKDNDNFICRKIS